MKYIKRFSTLDIARGKRVSNPGLIYIDDIAKNSAKKGGQSVKSLVVDNNGHLIIEEDENNTPNTPDGGGNSDGTNVTTHDLGIVIKDGISNAVIEHLDLTKFIKSDELIDFSLFEVWSDNNRSLSTTYFQNFDYIYEKNMSNQYEVEAGLTQIDNSEEYANDIKIVANNCIALAIDITIIANPNNYFNVDGFEEQTNMYTNDFEAWAANLADEAGEGVEVNSYVYKILTDVFEDKDVHEISINGTTYKVGLRGMAENIDIAYGEQYELDNDKIITIWPDGQAGEPVPTDLPADTAGIVIYYLSNWKSTSIKFIQ